MNRVEMSIKSLNLFILFYFKQKLSLNSSPNKITYSSLVWFLVDVHEIYTIKYLHIYIFSLTFMLFCD